MAYDFDGTDDYIEAASAAVTGVPLTMACWFNFDVATLTRVCLSVSNNGGNDSFAIQLAGALAGDPVRARTIAAGTAGQAASASGFTAGTWHHAAARFSAINNRRAYIDGVGGTTNNASLTPTNINTTTIGANWVSSARTDYMDGKIAEVGIWNVALEDAEIASLAKGFRCSLIRPQNLIFYAPIVRPVADYARGLSLTTSGAVVAVHPRRIA